jgi:hypothetical protein
VLDALELALRKTPSPTSKSLLA